MDISDPAAVSLDHASAGLGRLGKGRCGSDRDNRDREMLRVRLRTTADREFSRRADLVAKGGDRAVGRPINGENLVAVLQSRAFRGRSLQDTIDEMSPIHLARESSNAGIVR